LSHETIEVPGRPPPRGYNDGILARGGRLLFVAGQVAWDEQHRLIGGADFTAQFDRALANVLAVVNAAGGKPADLTRLTLYVVDLDSYRSALKRIGACYRERLGAHYPAMTLVQVAGLLEKGALVEIEATAVIAQPP